MADVAENEVVRRDYPVLGREPFESRLTTASHMATVGGNLLQRTRCPYFRNGAIGAYPCNKRAPVGMRRDWGVERGQAVLGISDACTAVSPGDWPVALTAMDATVEIQGWRDYDQFRSPNFTDCLVIRPISNSRSKPARSSPGCQFRRRRPAATRPISKCAIASHMLLPSPRQPWRWRWTAITYGRRILLSAALPPALAGTRGRGALNRRTIEPDIALAAGRAAFADARPGEHNAFKIELGARTLADAIMTAGRKMQ